MLLTGRWRPGRLRSKFSLPKGPIPARSRKPPRYWAREGEIAKSGLLSHLPAGISAPAIYAVTHADDGAIGIWMEDVQDARPGHWDMPHYRLAAQHFGQFNGAYLTGAAVPDYPWMSNERTVEWGRISQQSAPSLRDLKDTPIGSAVLPGETFAQTFALCEQLDMVISAMERLPQCFCHHDAFRNNVLMRTGPTGALETVAVDWAYCGHGRVGEEGGNLMAASASNLLIAPDEIGQLDQTVFAGYVDGLRQAGWQGDARLARLGYTASAFVVFGLALRGFAMMMLRAQGAAFEQSEARSNGRPHEEIFEHRRQIQPYLVGLGEEALRLARELA